MEKIVVAGLSLFHYPISNKVISQQLQGMFVALQRKNILWPPQRLRRVFLCCPVEHWASRGRPGGVSGRSGPPTHA